jgi:glycosyltransferase involved in cell wall biosynthesis
LIKVVYIISDIDKALAFEWIASYMDKSRFDLSFILINPGDSVLEQYLIREGFNVDRVTCAGKKDWPLAWWQLYKLIRKRKPEVVHCHLLQANILGLSAAKVAGVPKRIYTRHHSSLHHVYHPKGVFWDKLANRQATHIVAISAAVRNILVEWEKVPEAKITTIPHGFLLDSFKNVPEARVQAIREKYDIVDKGPVVGVIARFTVWKGIQYIIPAFRQLLDSYPRAVLLLFNARGDYAQEIERALADIPKERYRLIPFEQDVPAAIHAMDVYVHVPIDQHSEAFGQTYVEALAAGVPSIFSLSGIASDFIEDGENGLVVPFRDSEAIFAAASRILGDKYLREKLKQNGWNSVEKQFALSTMIRNLEHLYAG